MLCWLSRADAVSHDVSWSAHKSALWAPRNESVVTTLVAMVCSSFNECTGYGSLVHLGVSAYEFDWPPVSATRIVGCENSWYLMVCFNWVIALLVQIASIFGYLVDFWELVRRFSFWLFKGPQKRIWQARRCSSHRLKQPRFGWKCRHHTRFTLSVCRRLPRDFSPPLKSVPWDFPYLGRFWFSLGSGFRLLSCGNFGSHVGNRLFKWCFGETSARTTDDFRIPETFKMCRGGAGGSSATQRKRNAREREHELLIGLQGLLQTFAGIETEAQTRSGKGKGIPARPYNQQDDNKLKKDSRLDTDIGLLQGLQRLVKRAEKKPEGLLRRLQDFVGGAVSAAQQGKNINPKKQETQTKQGGC